MDSTKYIEGPHLKDLLEKLLEGMLQSNNANIIGESNHIKTFLDNNKAKFDKKVSLDTSHPHRYISKNTQIF